MDNSGRSSADRSRWGEGWIVKIRFSDRAELEGLLSSEDYTGLIADRESDEKQEEGDGEEEEE